MTEYNEMSKMQIRMEEADPGDYERCPGCGAWIHCGATGCKCGFDRDDMEEE